jgi:hypothetical protein
MAKKKTKVDFVGIAKKYVWLIVIGVLFGLAIAYFGGLIEISHKQKSDPGG